MKVANRSKLRRILSGLLSDHEDGDDIYSRNSGYLLNARRYNPEDITVRP
jgi:hypothetical protein